MKRMLTTIVLVALLLLTLNPIKNADASTQIGNGVYSTSNYYTIAEFKKLSSSNKAAVLTTPGTVVVLGTLVYKAADVLTASNSKLPTLGVKVSDYTTDEGNKLVSGEKLNSTGEFKITSIE